MSAAISPAAQANATVDCYKASRAQAPSAPPSTATPAPPRPAHNAVSITRSQTTTRLLKRRSLVTTAARGPSLHSGKECLIAFLASRQTSNEDNSGGVIRAGNIDRCFLLSFSHRRFFATLSALRPSRAFRANGHRAASAPVQAWRV